MHDLSVNIEVLDFDLETIGFHFNVINPDTAEPKSNSYFRMSLIELNVFIKALKASAANINLATPKSGRQSRNGYGIRDNGHRSVSPHHEMRSGSSVIFHPHQRERAGITGRGGANF